MVSSEAFVVRWPLLDERFDGNDNSFGSWTSAALRLGNFSIRASHGDDCCVSGHDAVFYFLGKFKRQIWSKTGKKFKGKIKIFCNFFYF